MNFCALRLTHPGHATLADPLFAARKEGKKCCLPSFPLAEERAVKRLSDDRVSRRSASKFRVSDGKGLARRRRAGAKRSPEQHGPEATPQAQSHPELFSGSHSTISQHDVHFAYEVLKQVQHDI